MRARRRTPFSAFVLGFGAGLALALALAALGGAYLLERGVTVSVAGSELAGGVASGVEAELRAELPAVLAQVKSEIPGKVAGRVESELGDTSFVLYGVRVDLPASATAGLRAKLRDEITKEFERQIDEVDVAGLAHAFAREAGAELARRLGAEFASHPLLVEILPGLFLPVQVVLR